MDYINRKWVIVNVSDITDEMIGSAMQSSMETLRKSLDNSKAILKFEGSTPNCFEDLNLYNHLEILTILKESDWTEEED
tara:strand:+ start:158 stop:394 length:237 start_codon:yes stop_codon:yes gene_type:complete